MLSMESESLPVGFRFHPTDEELVDHYLKLKILGMDSHVDIIPEVDVCKWEPWDLPGKLNHPTVLEFLDIFSSLYCAPLCSFLIDTNRCSRVVFLLPS